MRENRTILKGKSNHDDDDDDGNNKVDVKANVQSVAQRN